MNDKTTEPTPFDDHEAIAEELNKLGWVARNDAQWDHLKVWCAKKAAEWADATNAALPLRLHTAADRIEQLETELDILRNTGGYGL